MSGVTENIVRIREIINKSLRQEGWKKVLKMFYQICTLLITDFFLSFQGKKEGEGGIDQSNNTSYFPSVFITLLKEVEGGGIPRKTI